jgi:tetratricopeptide (TPR) repeat protein
VFGWSIRLLEVATLVNIDLAADGAVPQYQRDFALSVARRFLDLVSQGEPRAAAEPLTRAIVLVLQQSLKVEDLRAYLPRAVRQFPTSQELLLSFGSLHELIASQRLAAAREQRLVPRDIDEALRDAEQAYRQALALAPGFDPARIRLGHVLYRQRRYGESRKELQAVNVPLLSAQDGYLREVFTATVEEASGQWNAAIEAYRHAAAICSTCQVAQFGLARVYSSLGDVERSRAILQAALRAPDAQSDPWVVYDYAQAPMFPSLFAELKQLLCTPR